MAAHWGVKPGDHPRVRLNLATDHETGGSVFQPTCKRRSADRTRYAATFFRAWAQPDPEQRQQRSLPFLPSPLQNEHLVAGDMTSTAPAPPHARHWPPEYCPVPSHREHFSSV
jgi:hypothetical protein